VVAEGSRGPAAAAHAAQVLTKVAAELEEMDLAELISQIALPRERISMSGGGLGSAPGSAIAPMDDALLRDLQIIQLLLTALRGPRSTMATSLSNVTLSSMLHAPEPSTHSRPGALVAPTGQVGVASSRLKPGSNPQTTGGRGGAPLGPYAVVNGSVPAFMGISNAHGQELAAEAS